MGPTSFAGWRWLERALMAVGIVCVGWVGLVTLQGEMNRSRVREFEGSKVRGFDGSKVLGFEPSNPATLGPSNPRTVEPLPVPIAPRRGAVFGVLEIPRLRFSEVVAEGDDDATLNVAIGHLPDTPLPWTIGNSGFAGHRDKHFRALRGISIGDHIRLKTEGGTFDYRVKDKMIVSPQDVWVLAPSTDRRLTLITCYPFSYVGRAPQRFIVKAESVHAPPETRGAVPTAPPKTTDLP
jgi:sortase A